jgi:glycine cleavage system H lipoate-binding protein
MKSWMQNPNSLIQILTADGWMVKISLANPGDVDGLLSAEDYQKFIGA